MAITGNKGEWSEMYVFLKLLGEGKVYAGDANLNKLIGLFYPIVMILRQEEEERLHYKRIDRDVVIVKSSGEEIVRKPAIEFLEEAECLLCK